MLDDNDPDIIPPCPFAVGDQFETLSALKSAAREYAIRTFFKFTTVHASKMRWRIACKAEGCHWGLYATSIAGANNIFRIKTLHPDYDCVGMDHGGHRQANTQFIAEWILDKVKSNPRYRPKDIVEDVKVQLGITITWSKAFRGKEHALEIMYGTHLDAYKAIPQYIADIEQTNPNSLATIESTTENRFKRVFICFGASAMGFSHCRPVLSLDTTHLKTRYQGILLAATGMDALGKLFPVAFAVVVAENNDNWLWMLELLCRVLEQSTPEFLEPKVSPQIANSECRNSPSFLIDKRALSKQLTESFQALHTVTACAISLKTSIRSSNTPT